MYDYFVIGSTGFLGRNCVKYLEMCGRTIFKCSARLENPLKIKEQLDSSGAKYVICAAGLSGHPIIDYCEAHPDETRAVNYTGMLNLMDVCEGRHLTIFGSGYVYTGAKSLYTETDEPDLVDKVYCRYKILLEKELRPNVLYLRIMYPCSFDGFERCFYTKTMNRRGGGIHDCKVSITSMPDLFPHLPNLIESGTDGIFNFVIDGAVSLKEFVDETASLSGETGYGNYELSAEKLKTRIPVLKNKDLIFRLKCRSS